MPNAQDPQQIIAQHQEAKRAARELLPASSDRVARLRDELKAAEAEEDALRLIAGVEPTEFRREASKPSPTADIIAVMSGQDPMSVTDIKMAIKEKFGREWADSSLWNRLKGAKDHGKVANANGKWSLIRQGQKK